MVKPLPTVEELVKVFKDNNWQVQSGAEGAEADNIREGKCCAMPAVLAVEHKDKLDKLVALNQCGQRLYDNINDIYGKHASGVWKGFDSPWFYTDETLTKMDLPAESKHAIRTGRDLRIALDPKPNDS